MQEVSHIEDSVGVSLAAGSSRVVLGIWQGAGSGGGVLAQDLRLSDSPRSNHPPTRGSQLCLALAWMPPGKDIL